MNKQRKTSHILNVFQYDETTGAVTLPSTLVLTAPAGSDNSTKVPTTAWTRSYISSLGYVTGNQSISITGDATGSGSTSIELTLANTAVTPGTYGSATLVPVVTVDSKGRITSVTTAAISGALTFTGDVTGTGTTGSSTTLTLANSGVTAGTFTKVTVDSKGRVTVGASATTSDISEGTNLYYTDARVLAYLGANNYATQSYVSTQINNLVAGAPGLLDTLDELAAALGDDANFATTTATSLGNRLRVDTAAQGLTSTQQGYGRTNLGLGSAALSATGDFATAAQGTKADTAHGWGNHASAGYLTTSSAASTYVSLTGSYANPSWITSLAYSKITGVPAFLTSYTETDPYRVTAVAVSGTSTKTITLTRADSSTVTTTWTDYDTDTNTYVTSAAFSGGTLTLTRNDSGTVSVSLDGRYYLASNPSGYITSSALSSYLPLSGGTMTGQILGPSIGSDVYGGAIQIRERGYVLESQSAWSYSPAITFHWGNRWAKRFGGRYDGLFAIDDEPIALRSWVTSQGYVTTSGLSTDSDSEQTIGGRIHYFNAGVARMNIDPRWNESGYDGDLGCFHIWAWTAGGSPYGRAGIALYNGSAYQYITTKASDSNVYINNSAIVTNGNTPGIIGAKYQINDTWLRVVNDDRQFQIYGNARTMIYRTDGNNNSHGGGGYAHLFYYGGSADSQRVFIINTDGRLYSPYHGWLDTMSVAYASSAGSVAWGNVSGRPTAVSSFSNDSGYITSGGEINRTYRGIIQDTRGGQRTPNDYDDYRVSWEFTNQIVSGWHSVMTLQGWHDGYAAWQIIGPSDSAHENWYLRSGNNTSWNSLRSIIHSGNIASQSVSYASSAGGVGWGNVSSKPADWLTTTNLIADNTPGDTVGYIPSGFWQNYAGAGNPTGTWFNYINVRHSNPGNNHGFQLGMSYYDSNLWFRSYQGGGSSNGWCRALSSANWTSFINAPNAIGNGNGYYNVENWLQVNGSHGIFWPGYYSFHIRPNISSTYTQMEIIGSKNSYGGIYDNYSAVNVAMYDSGGNGGVYREANGRWFWYHHIGNNCTGISTSSTSSSYRAYIGGALYAEGDIVAYSDVRKKTDIVTIDNALEKVINLRGVYYTRIDDTTRGRQTGVIAQEINEVLPEVVTYAADVDEYGVSYGNIAGVLIEAIKEQQLQIENLKNKLDLLTQNK